MSGIVVLAEHENGVFKKTTYELLGRAVQLAQSLGTSVAAAVLGQAPAAELGAYGATQVYQVSADFSTYSTTQVVAALAAVVEASGASTLIASASYLGKDALPRLAARLDGAQATECVDLHVAEGQLVATRPLYAGKCLAQVRVLRGPGLFTVRPNSFPEPTPGAGTAQVVPVACDLPEPLLRVVGDKQPEATVVDLTEADRIVSGGRSLKSREAFDSVIRSLAASIGATPGASRAAVDAGYADHSDQVGQTGKVVNPTLYIACGISGAIQHLAGMRTSKVIVAINKDPEAPIFEHATYGIVDDLFDVCPKLEASFKTLNG